MRTRNHVARAIALTNAHEATKVITKEQAQFELTRRRILKDIIAAEMSRRDRYRTLRFAPITDERQMPKMGDAVWLHMLLDAISGPPRLSKVYLAGLGKIGLAKGVFWPLGARCEIRIRPMALKDRDKHAVFNELVGADTMRKSDYITDLLEGMSPWLKQNLHRSG